MMIPQEPGTPGAATDITDNVVGLMTNGVLLDTHEQTWAYDSCDGHSDKSHQYHYHIPPICYLKDMGVPTPAADNWWIADNGSEVRTYAEMSDQWPSTGSSPVIGFARDGFPIYGLYDADGNIQRSKVFGGDLDECNGKEDSNGYGYYITAEPPFVPTCLKGSIGSFAFAATDIACPKGGISNTIVGVTAPPTLDVGDALDDVPTGGGETTGGEDVAEADESEEESAAFAKVPIFSALVAILGSTAAFFV